VLWLVVRVKILSGVSALNVKVLPLINVKIKRKTSDFRLQVADLYIDFSISNIFTICIFKSGIFQLMEDADDR
jgi:hypothetical protein